MSSDTKRLPFWAAIVIVIACYALAQAVWKWCEPGIRENVRVWLNEAPQ